MHAIRSLAFCGMLLIAVSVHANPSAVDMIQQYTKCIEQAPDGKMIWDCSKFYGDQTTRTVPIFMMGECRVRKGQYIENVNFFDPQLQSTRHLTSFNTSCGGLSETRDDQTLNQLILRPGEISFMDTASPFRWLRTYTQELTQELKITAFSATPERTLIQVKTDSGDDLRVECDARNNLPVLFEASRNGTPLRTISIEWNTDPVVHPKTIISELYDYNGAVDFLFSHTNIKFSGEEIPASAMEIPIGPEMVVQDCRTEPAVTYMTRLAPSFSNAHLFSLMPEVMKEVLEGI